MMAGQYSDAELLARLQEGAKSYRCGGYLQSLIPLERWQLYVDLEHERLTTKFKELTTLYKANGESWSELLYAKLLDSISDMSNRRCYRYIAQSISYKELKRCGSVEEVELILISLSGLLPTLEYNDDVMEIIEDGGVLLSDRELRPLSAGAWRLGGIKPTNHPIIRLSQIAHLIYDRRSLFDSLLAIRNRQDIHFIFGVKASPFWCKILAKGSLLGIGADKCDLLGINLVVPMLFAYGLQSGNDDYGDIATDLNESLPAESNSLIDGWRRSGLQPTCSYETQALLQLSKVYCKDKMCHTCPIFRHIRFGLREGYESAQQIFKSR